MAWRNILFGSVATLALCLLLSDPATSVAVSSKCSCKPHRLKCRGKEVIAVTDARHVYSVTSPANDACLRRMMQPRTCPKKKDPCCKWNGKMDASGSLPHRDAGQLHAKCWGQNKCLFRVNATAADPGPSSHMAVPFVSSLEYQCVHGSALTSFASSSPVTSKRVMTSFVAGNLADYFPSNSASEAKNTWLCSVSSGKAVKTLVALANPHKPRPASAACDVTLTAGSSTLPCHDIYLSFPQTTPFNLTFHLSRKHVPTAAYVVISADSEVTLQCGNKLLPDVTTTTTEATTTPTTTTPPTTTPTTTPPTTTTTTATTTTTTLTTTTSTTATETSKSVMPSKSVTEDASGDDVISTSPLLADQNPAVSDVPGLEETTAKPDDVTQDDVTPQQRRSSSKSAAPSRLVPDVLLAAVMLTLLVCV